MKHCEYCGSELPSDARFCGYCGHALSELTQEAIDITSPSELDVLTLKTTPPPLLSDPLHPGVINTETGQEDVDITSRHKWSDGGNIPGNQNLEERQNEENRAVLSDMMLLSTQMGEGQAPVGNVPAVQGTPQTSAVPTVPGTPAMPANPPAPSAPAGVLQTPHRHWLPRVRYLLRPHGLASHLLIATVVVTVGASALLVFLHLRFPGTGGISGIVLTQHLGRGATPSASYCQTPTNFTSSNCLATQTSFATAPGLTAALTFSGGVVGRMTVNQFPNCGPTNQTAGFGYVVDLNGTIGGQLYGFSLGVISYTGPGTYNANLIAANLILANDSSRHWFNDNGILPARVMINKDQKSGTLDIDLFGTDKVHVSGSWQCARG